MATSWKVTLDSAVNDSSGQNLNVNVTLILTNTVTGEVQTKVLPGNNWSKEKLIGVAQDWIATVQARDASLVALQAAAATKPILAVG